MAKYTHTHTFFSFHFLLLFSSHIQRNCQVAFGNGLKIELILLFSFIHGLTSFFGTIHESYCTILVNFYIYLEYFQQKVFSFN